MSGVEWVDELPDPYENRRGAPRIWEDLLLPLMERPGSWAQIRTAKSRQAAATRAAQLRIRRGAYVPPGRWEFASRGQPDGTGAIYARYLGPTDEAAS